MPLDGAMLQCIKNELTAAIECHIDKIHMPSKNEFVLTLRERKEVKKLYISIAPDCPRISFTDTSFENPSSPPMFCMLLRKHLASGRIIGLEGLGAERLIKIKVQTMSELGDRVVNTLVVELIGHKTNLILLGADNRIIDAARKSDIEKGDRLIQPGVLYENPENSGKIDLLEGDLTKAADKILCNPEQRLSDAILSSVAGISPLICREVAFCLGKDTDCGVNSISKTMLLDKFTELKNEVLKGGAPYIIFDENNLPKDYSFTEIRQYGGLFTLKKAESYSALLQIFYGERERLRRLEQNKGDLLKLIKNLIARNSKKLLLREKELKKSQDRDILRIYGELIKANLYRLEKGATKAVVENYYDPEGKTIEIPLNSAITPSANAAKYFKDYKKACTAAQTLGALIKECKKEGEYLESVLFELQSADNTAELEEIKSELIETGYIKLRKVNKKARANAKPLTFTKNGFEIKVGRNNIQNDELTLKIASKNDLWFHTKNIHGSHVILFAGGKEPDDDTLLYAANLAAKYSKAGSSNQVPVDYTPVKFVKKPSGAKPGMVIYTTNKTIYANPLEVK